MTKPGAGKFQYNESQEESEILYQHSLDNSHPNFGDSNTFGWFSLIVQEALTETEKTVCGHAAYICEENSQGFFIITPYESPVEAMRVYSDLESEWAQYEMETLA